MSVLASLLEEGEEIGASLPEAARSMFLVMTGQLEQLNDQVALLDKEIARRARENEAARRWMTIPGIGPITATALLALAPPVEGFARGRDFAAWLGLTPRQHSTGGKERLGTISRMGERTLRRLLIVGSSAVVLHASKRGAPRGSWLEQMLARKPRMLVTVALANKTARIIWAVVIKGEDYGPRRIDLIIGTRSTWIISSASLTPILNDDTIETGEAWMPRTSLMLRWTIPWPDRNGSRTSLKERLTAACSLFTDDWLEPSARPRAV